MTQALLDAINNEPPTAPTPVPQAWVDCGGDALQRIPFVRRKYLEALPGRILLSVAEELGVALDTPETREQLIDAICNHGEHAQHV